jgi:ketosteroid isomerase-like protein
MELSRRRSSRASILAAMSEENVEIVRALIPPSEVDLVALFRDDNLFEQLVAAVEPAIDPQVESVAVWQAGTARVFVGLDGFRRLWLDWLEPWATYHTRVDEVIDAGDRVVTLIRDRASRPGAEAEVELLAGSVWEIRDGRVARVEFFGSRAEALEAAGLPR